MNIDEFESGKGLRLYFSGIREYAKRQAQILTLKDNTRWHYKQRRVRARREKAERIIKRFLLIYPQATKMMAKKVGRRNFVRIYINQDDLCQ